MKRMMVRYRVRLDQAAANARYIKDVCPVAELGVRNEMAHKVDENIPVDEIETLCRIYYRLLASYFAPA